MSQPLRPLRRRRRRRAQAGFTLIEMMVSLVLFSFAIAGVLAVAVAMVNGFREQRLSVNTEAASRSAMDFMSDGLRGASPAVTTGVIYHPDPDGTCIDKAFNLINSPSQPDELQVVFAYGSVVTSSRAIYTGGTTLEVADASELSAGDSVLITDHAVGHLFKITGISTNELTGSITCSANIPTGGYKAGSIVVRALDVVFYIENLDNIPTLWMDPDPGALVSAAEPLAEGIEDMQIAVAMDTGTDGVSEIGVAAGDDEWIHNVAGETLPLTGAFRAVRITFIAQGIGKASGAVTTTGSSYRPAAEDRPVAASPDNYRRRVLTSIVEVRNLGGSP